MKLNIKGLRVSMGLGQDELAIKTGIGLYSLRRLEQNDLRINRKGAKSVMINGDHIDQLCEVLQCSVADLILVESNQVKEAKVFVADKHVRTAWIISLVYCSRLYYFLMSQYKKNTFGKVKEQSAFKCYSSLQSAILKVFKIELQCLSSNGKGIQKTMLWIWGSQI